MSDTRGEGCGIWPVILGGRFYAACEWHDEAYLEKSWHQGELTRKEVDRHFLRQMLRLAGGSIARRAQAYAYYGIARALGGLWWEGDT